MNRLPIHPPWVAVSVLVAALAASSCDDGPRVGGDPSVTAAPRQTNVAQTPREGSHNEDADLGSENLLIDSLEAREGQRGSPPARTVSATLIDALGAFAHDLEVVESEGVILVDGEVPTSYEKERVRDVLSRVVGVRAFADSVEVSPSEVQDDEIVREVQTALAAEPAVEVWDIDVSAIAGAVSLRGHADSQVERVLAADAAKRVRGVKGVVNGLEVVATDDRSDEEIRMDVQRALQRDLYVDASLLAVTTEEGRVVLVGAVDSEEAKQRASVLASVAGAEEVDLDDVRIDPALADERLRTAPVVASPADVADAVGLALEHAGLPLAEVVITLSDGVASLHGEVDTLEDKRRAERAAGAAVGVVTVDNQLRVAREAQPPTQVELSERLRDGGVEGEVRPLVRDRVVELRGMVESQYHLTLAEELVADVPGVDRVVNGLTIQMPGVIGRQAEFGAEGRPLAERVRSALDQSRLDDEGVIVLVDEDEVTLSGDVTSREALRRAVQAAYDAGASRVYSQLTIGE